MNDELLLPWLVGTFTCTLGFWKWPKRSIEFLRPRFVVPIAIWTAVFAQAAVFAVTDMPMDIYAYSRAWYGPDALWYTTYCVAGFWVGHMLPFGTWLARPLASLARSIQINSERLQPVGATLIIIATLVYLVSSGGRDLGIQGDEPLIALSPGLLDRIGIVASLMSFAGAVIVGFSWPDEGRRSPLTALPRVVLLLLACLPSMSNFSRGSGLPMLLAAGVYCIRRRRFGWPAFAALFWCVLCAHAGLRGRGMYGHDGGALNFFRFLFENSLADYKNLVNVALECADAFTPLTVEMRADRVTDVRLLSPAQWLLSQVPLPRSSGLLPEWTPDYTLFLGGHGGWGYTVSFLGDINGHLGNWGILVFTLWGICYRVVGELAFRSFDWDEDRIQVYVLLLFATYGALALGIFNTNRAMVVGFFAPTYICIGALLLSRFIRNQRTVVAT